MLLSFFQPRRLGWESRSLSLHCELVSEQIQGLNERGTPGEGCCHPRALGQTTSLRAFARQHSLGSLYRILKT